MDIRKVKKLIEMLEESSLAEIEIREGEETIRISRASSVGTGAPGVNTATQGIHHAASAPSPSPAAHVRAPSEPVAASTPGTRGVGWPSSSLENCRSVMRRETGNTPASASAA